MTALRGRLLVASPNLADPNFDRTVVLVLEHGDEGALGLVLNRPSDTDLSETLPQWKAFASFPTVVFVGGPVSPGAGICLARVHDEREAEGWRPLFSRLGTVDLGHDPHEIAVGLEEVRVFAGYAGWDGGQLESEITAGGWFVVASQPGDGFTADPDGLWRSVLRRQGGRLAMMASYPRDLSAN